MPLIFFLFYLVKQKSESQMHKPKQIKIFMDLKYNLKNIKNIKQTQGNIMCGIYKYQRNNNIK